MTVNRQLLQQAIDTMPNELTTELLYDTSTQLYCAFGWLGHVAGMSDSDLTDNIGVYNRIADAYGLDHDAVDEITSYNDGELNDPDDIKKFLLEEYLNADN